MQERTEPEKNETKLTCDGQLNSNADCMLYPKTNIKDNLKTEQNKISFKEEDCISATSSELDALTTEQLTENSEKREDKFQFLNRSFADSLYEFVNDNYGNKCSTSTSNKQAQNEPNFSKFNKLNNDFGNTKENPNESKTDVSVNEGNLFCQPEM